MEPNSAPSDTPSQENANFEQLHISASITAKAEQKEKPLYRETVIAAGVIGLFLGGFGVHNFITHRYSRGAAQVALTISAFGTIMILFVVEFIDTFKCGTGEISSCPHLGIPYNLIYAICFRGIILPTYAWGVIESFIMLVKAGQYPLKNDPNQKPEPPNPPHINV